MDIYLEYDLTRTGRPSVLILKKRGSCFSIIVLEKAESGEWTGEAGAMTADECLFVAEDLHDWIVDPPYDDRGLREPCRTDVLVTNYGIVTRHEGDDRLDGGEPYPEVASVTLIVETDGDASYLMDLFREMNRRLRGFR